MEQAKNSSFAHKTNLALNATINQKCNLRINKKSYFFALFNTFGMIINHQDEQDDTLNKSEKINVQVCFCMMNLFDFEQLENSKQLHQLMPKMYFDHN